MISAARLDHIAFGVSRVDSVSSLMEGTLGGHPAISGPGIEFSGGQWEFCRGAMLEAIEPDGTEGGFMHRFLSARGPGVHHITFKIDNIIEARRNVEECGYEVVGFSDAVPSWKEMFLHPKQALGVVVQIVEFRPDLGDDGWGPDWRFTRYKGETAAPADIAGLRMTCNDFGQARRLWNGLLGGQESIKHGVLAFEWVDSPLRISVVADPKRAPGPLAIEIRNNANTAAIPDFDANVGSHFIVI